MRLDHIDTWVFDLDNTLYPASCRLFDQVDRNMGAFICEFLKLDPVEARALQKRYLKEFGTTLRGLMINHECPPERFLEAAHAIDYSAVQPDARLGAALERLPGRKLIFTNGSVAHAERVMDRLGVVDHFSGVFDIVAAGYLPKPEMAAYEGLIRSHAVEPRRAALIEDLPRNLVPAAALGMTTVLVKTDSVWAQDAAEGDHIHHVTDDLPAWLEAAGRSGRPRT
ncbi:MAG: putative pyrimidine 5-nucleotidase [Rhodospirillales bacterium]|jgi:putative hydrolase of the HAD superfamily|nr:putative pyrimidine 5-nucleotidase [Rhodospirillales bacterium]